ncbi:MAG: cytochrome c oxidase subunit II [Ignavibacteriaceae bacterium]|nr:cytochrome c oxidase subunit II [Ignavibacteriaceae bacterium]
MIAQASNLVHTVDQTFYFIVGVSVFFLVLITGCMIYFVIRYSRKRNPKATNIHGNIPLEITWTVIPTILALIMFWFGWTDYKLESTPPADAYNIDVTGQMWHWTFKYPNGVEMDSLFLPLDKDIKVNIRSKDVNHSFFVPAFRVKKDAIPGRTNTAWFRTEKEGVYNLFCAEYCGMKHSYMITKVVVIPVNDFNALLNRKLNEMNSAASKDTTK